jgi:hypothetical protein
MKWFTRPTQQAGVSSSGSKFGFFMDCDVIPSHFRCAFVNFSCYCVVNFLRVLFYYLSSSLMYVPH